MQPIQQTELSESTVTSIERPALTQASGLNMDVPLEKQRWPFKKYSIAAAALVILVSLAIAFGDFSGDSKYQLNGDRLKVATVSQGVFEDYTPIRGRIAPRTTVFLESTEGGRIYEVAVEDGDLVQRNQMLIRLSNSDLQLSVTNAEAQVAEQLNNMRANELALEQNRLRNAREILNTQYRIQTLQRELGNERKLLQQQAIQKNSVEQKEEELIYQKNLLTLQKQSQETEQRLQEQQLKAQKITAERLEKNLDVARKNLDDLNIRAPISGKLSGFDAEVGQTVARGGRIGQVDVPNEFKLTANVDEFYINRIDLGLKVSYQHNGDTYIGTVKKIYPQVKNGEFEIDIDLGDSPPAGLRRGQSLQGQLTLGDKSEALLIPNGAFYQDTGGHWIFVLNREGDEAVKRQVTLGRKNSKFIEVLDGLESGEKVITSSYEDIKDIDRLLIDNGDT